MEDIDMDDDMDGLDGAVEEIFLDNIDDIQMTPGADTTDSSSVVEEGIDDSL